MAKKQKAINVTIRAPKAVKRGSAKRPRRPHSNGMQMSGNSRAAISAVMPRPYKRMRSVRDDCVEVSGMELISSVSTSVGPEAWQFFLNPGNSQYFKSLASTAFSYEKFRFRRLRLRYWSQAPSSRSGVISGVILLDPLSMPPGDPQGFMAYAHSFTRPISLDGASVQHSINDPKWFYVNSTSTTANITDPTTRYQGIVSWQSQGAATADANIVSGYIGLEYVCEFDGHRPVRNSVLVTNTNGDTEYKTGTTQLVNYETVPNVIGSYDLQVEGEGETQNVPGYDSNYTYSDSFLSYLGKHLINYTFPLGGALANGVPVEEEKGFSPRPSVSLFREKRGGPWCLEVGGAQVDTVPRWVSVLCVSPDDELKSAMIAHPIRLRDLKTSEQYRIKGNAAGDVSVSIYCGEPNGSSETIDQTLFSLGTGAVTLRRCLAFTESSRNCRLLLDVSPTGSESRTETAASSVAYVEANGDEALL